MEDTVMIKKLSVLLLILVLVCPACATLAAADSSESDQVTVYWDKCTEGEEYMIFFLRNGVNPSSFTAEDVLFMDQVTSGSGGVINALFLSPGSDPFQICLSGVFTDGSSSPHIIGSYQPVAVTALHTPASLTEIEEEAFEGGTFTHVYLGEQVTRIGARAFAGCAELQYIEILSTTVSIASNAFHQSPNVTIGCRADSDAYRYAVQNGIPYRIVQG